MHLKLIKILQMGLTLSLVLVVNLKMKVKLSIFKSIHQTNNIQNTRPLFYIIKCYKARRIRQQVMVVYLRAT